jgi:hypothetical protein
MCASRIDVAFPCIHNIFFTFRIAFFVILASSIVENSTDDLDESACLDKMPTALVVSGAGGSQRRLAGGESRGEAEGEDQFFHFMARAYEAILLFSEWDVVAVAHHVTDPSALTLRLLRGLTVNLFSAFGTNHQP